MKRRGFTLIELLVVVAIISLLIAILLPALSGARRAAENVGCLSMQRQLMVAMVGYTEFNQEWLPGINTSGWRHYTDPSYPDSGELDQNPLAPVQNFDWMSPIIGDDLSPNRAQRFYDLLEKFSCPSMKERVVPYGGSNAYDLDELEEINNARGGFRGTSYLMSAFFQYAGKPGDIVMGPGGSVTYPMASGIESQVNSNDNYIPKKSAMGLLSKKAVIADGFRYIDMSEGPDFDASTNPTYYGSFAHSTPTFINSKEYADETGSDGSGPGFPFSYRHGEGMNVAFMDGSASGITVIESRDPTYWWPSGSIFKGPQAHADAFRYYEINDVIY